MDWVTQVFKKKTCHSTRRIGCRTLRLAADNLSAQFEQYRFGWLQVRRVRWVPVRDGQPCSHTYIYLSIYTTILAASFTLDNYCIQSFKFLPLWPEWLEFSVPWLKPMQRNPMFRFVSNIGLNWCFGQDFGILGDMDYPDQ